MGGNKGRLIKFDFHSTNHSASSQKCHKCNEDFEPKEIVFSKPLGSSKTKLYHKVCAELVNLI